MKQPKPLNALEFEERYPEVQTRTATISQLRAKTFNLPVQPGTVLLPNPGDVSLQLNAGSVVFVATYGGTTFYFNPSGTL